MGSAYILNQCTTLLCSGNLGHSKVERFHTQNLCSAFLTLIPLRRSDFNQAEVSNMQYGSSPVACCSNLKGHTLQRAFLNIATPVSSTTALQKCVQKDLLHTDIRLPMCNYSKSRKESKSKSKDNERTDIRLMLGQRG